MRKSRLICLVCMFVAVESGARAATKTISYELLEDYRKGFDLQEVAKDFQLMRSMGLDTWRGSFAWDDLEPYRGVYDFTWLHQFANLAEEYGIKLRPYIAYTAPWAAAGGNSSNYYVYPPAELQDWISFLEKLSSEMSVHRNILSYELWNEIDNTDFWVGTMTQYDDLLKAGALAIRAGNPNVQVFMAGLVFPDYDWLNSLCSDAQAGKYFDVAPFHAYPETWDDSTVENYLDVQYYGWYVPEVKHRCGGQPIWMNEMGYATTPGRTERQQAYWWARAYATYLSDDHIAELGIYQIRDVPPGQSVIGGAANYHLGITTKDRVPKMAYFTLTALVKLLPQGMLTTADGQLSETVTAGVAVAPYYHLFERQDGHQIVFAYDKQGTPTVNLTLPVAGTKAISYSLDGTATPYTNFDGRTLIGVGLAPGEISIFEIVP